MLRVAATQMRSGSDKERNLETAVRLIDLAAERGDEVVAFPEVFTIRGRGLSAPNAEPIPGPTTDLLGEKARERRIWILGGSIPERAPEAAPRLFNTSTLISPTGEIVARYRKIHLFDVTLTDGPTSRESDSYAPGDEIVTADPDDTHVGLSVCYDLRFPELYRALAMAGARIVFVPSAFSAMTGAHHWHVLLRARAIEDQFFVVAPAQIGGTADAMDTYGHALIADPWGRVLAEAGDHDELITADLDLDSLDRIRVELPLLANRRL